jgi:hypothetical protein
LLARAVGYVYDVFVVNRLRSLASLGGVSESDLVFLPTTPGVDKSGQRQCWLSTSVSTLGRQWVPM